MGQMIQEIGSKSKLKIVRHRERDSNYFIKLIGAKNLMQESKKNKPKLLVQVGQVEGLFRTSA
jgi:hypothetical protein